MGDHAVVFVQDNSVPFEPESGEEPDPDREPATLLAFSLKDHSVQEAEICHFTFCFQFGGYSFLKYGENQIIKYDNKCNGSEYSADSMICITVESFSRIL